MTAQLLDYPFPLDDGTEATLKLPKALTRREAARLAAYVSALPVEEEDLSTPSRGRAVDDP